MENWSLVSTQLQVFIFLGPHSDSRYKNSSHSFGRTGWNLQCFLKYFKRQHIWFFKRYKPAVLVLHSDQMDFKLLLCGPWDVDPNELLQTWALNKNYGTGKCWCNKTSNPHQLQIFAKHEQKWENAISSVHNLSQILPQFVRDTSIYSAEFLPMNSTASVHTHCCKTYLWEG